MRIISFRRRLNAGTVPANNEYAAGTLKKMNIKKVPHPPKSKPQFSSKISRLEETLIPEGNQFPGISPCSYRAIPAWLRIKVKQVPLL